MNFLRNVNKNLEIRNILSELLPPYGTQHNQIGLILPILWAFFCFRTAFAFGDQNSLGVRGNVHALIAIAIVAIAT